MSSIGDAFKKAGITTKAVDTPKEKHDLTRYYELVPFFERFLSNAESMGKFFLDGQKPSLTLLKLVAEAFKDNTEFKKRTQRHYSNILRKQGWKEESFGDLVDFGSIWKLRAIGYAFIDLLKQNNAYGVESINKAHNILKAQDKLVDEVLNSFIY